MFRTPKTVIVCNILIRMKELSTLIREKISKLKSGTNVDLGRVRFLESCLSVLQNEYKCDFCNISCEEKHCCVIKEKNLLKKIESLPIDNKKES